jgi:toxin YoeB
MVNYRLVFTKQAQKDAKKANQAGLRARIERLLKILEQDPYARHPPFEKLFGDLSGACSRRINIHHRLIYQVYEKEKAIKVIRMWTHYSE